MPTCTKSSLIQIEIPYTLSEARFILFKHATSITPATTYSGSVTPSTLVHTQILCCALPLMRKVLNPTGMREFLASIMPTFWAENSVIPGARNVRHMDFLWVRWFSEAPGYRSGFHRARLPAIGFVESTDDFAFSFVDPANVLCGCYLIPAFDAGGC